MDLIAIKDKLWNGSLNVTIVLPINGTDKHFFLTIHRNSYFPIQFPTIVEFFAQELPVLARVPIWLEYDGIPISWNLPVGVLYDYLHLPVVDRDDASSASWTLKLHYAGSGGDYPWEQIVPFQFRLNTRIDYERSLKEIVINQLKQSTFILNGNSKPIMNLNEADSNELFTAIKLHNLQSFTKIENKILRQIVKLQKLPLKVYIPGTSHIIQSPVLPIDPNDQSKSVNLRRFLIEQFPDLFTATSCLATPCIQGIDVSCLLDADLSLKQIWEIFRHADNFLHIVLIIKNESLGL